LKPLPALIAGPLFAKREAGSSPPIENDLMKSKLLNKEPATYAVVFKDGDEAMAGLERFAANQELKASEFMAVGAFQKCVLGYFNFDTMDYDRIEIDEQVEVLSLIGNVTLGPKKRKIHAHVVVGKRDGTAHGGHLLQAHVRPTLEVILTELPANLQRQHDEKTGLSLIAIGDAQ
jgi:predicted DNA-binding protein with PD1-like motif